MSLPPAVVLLSGGVDSAVALACARRDGFACYALTVAYGQRHACELRAAAAIARAYAATHRVVTVDLRALGGSALTDDRIPVPKDRPPGELTAGVPPTYVPARNTLLLALALAWAETLDARDIYIGVNAVDFSGYPDCRRPFIEAFERVAALGTRAGTESGARFVIHTPLVAMSKAQIIRLGVELGVDFSLTHSCYDPDDAGRACGRCDSCQIRRRGFAEAGLPDPTPYVGACP